MEYCTIFFKLHWFTVNPYILHVLVFVRKFKDKKMCYNDNLYLQIKQLQKHIVTFTVDSFD